MMRRIGFFVLAALALTGCDLPGRVSAPTPYPPDYIPTVVYLTAVSIDGATRSAATPTVVPSETNTLMPPTLAPSATPTTGPRVPDAAIQMRAPGPMSRIISPLNVQLLAFAGASKRVEIALFGEDGRLLGRALVAVRGSPAGDGIAIKMPFEIRAVGENGYVQVSTKDARGRIQALITVPVLLLSSGESQVNPAGNTVYERVALAGLLPEAEVAGGVLQLVGQVLPSNPNPFIIELISEAGDTLSLRVVNVSGTDWQPVDTTLPYRVTRTTNARLFIRQAGDLLEDDIYVFSQAVTLNP